jgi:hypothetical protein
MIDSLPESWDLPAPESQVLLTGPDTPDDWAIKLALKELVLRRVLSVRTVRIRRFLVLHKNLPIVVDGERRDATVSAPLQAMLSVFPRPTTFEFGVPGVPLRTATIEVMRWYRAGGGFVEAEVLPELRRLGLYEHHLDGTAPRWRPTASGEQKLTELRQVMRTGRDQFPHWAETDRALATEYVKRAGPALLLLGNPVPWVWVLLMATLSGDASLALPPADPFAEEVELDKRVDGDGGGSVGRGDDERSSDDDDDPADTIDEAVDDASGDFGGDDGDGSGE